ncbi:MAG TPA: MarR family transcriptional regulator [Ignavibacteria bacterium]|nr:MarR family transcriptional regulator [Ignavibacteria bacterium]HQY51923.1 MarR family transcriptional regulator [Ignavibacteria bacterium]
MKIEDEIKQKKFNSEYTKLIINLVYTGNKMNFKTNELLKVKNLTIQQYNVLRILRGQHPNPSTVNMIIDRMLDKMSNASRIIDKLEDKKLVVRKINFEDKRCADVMISEKGLELLKKLDSEINNNEKSFIHLSLQEVKILNDLLDKLRG